MKYRIKYNYNTGDSFHTKEGLEAYLECSWENLEIAKANLQRIREHYEFSKRMDLSFSWEQKKAEDSEKVAKTKDWYIKKYATSCLKLQADNGNFFQFYAPWCGYFESLNEIEIVADNTDMKVCFKFLDKK